jgi:Glutamine amidotransferases class-II
MCMLCVISPNVTPSRSKLENSALNNPDGFGFAIAIPAENRIHVETTMNADTSINRFLEMRALYPDTYAIWHARLATHGTTNVDNCHPFRVGNDSRTVLAHNGILPVVMEKDDKRSDTRVFAEEVLPDMGGIYALDNDQLFNVLEEFCAGSKVAVLTVDPSAKHTCYVINEKLGKFDEDGVWWSNDSCSLTYYTSAYSGSKWTSSRDLTAFFDNESIVRNPNEYGYIDEYCYVCGSLSDIDDDAEKAICGTCHSCLLCYMSSVDCMCYVPERPLLTDYDMGF